MSDTTVTNADIASLAATLEGLADQFSEQEQATLHVLFGLAGLAVELSVEDVSGFQFAASPPQVAVTLPGTGGMLSGLNASFGGLGIEPAMGRMKGWPKNTGGH